MRIASVSTEYPSPRHRQRGLFIQRRLEALTEFADVRVLHLEPWFPWLRPVPTSPPADPADCPPATHLRMFYLPGVLKSWDGRWVERAVRPAVRALEAEAGPVDLIDAHFGYPEGVGCVRAAEEMGRPAFITMRGLESFILRDRAKGPQLRGALGRCAGVVCVSESLRALALEHGVAPERARVIPNAVNRQVFHAGDRAEARRSLGLDGSGRLIVAVGMLVHGKGHHLLIGALARLRERSPDLRLAVIGGVAHEPGYPDTLRKQIDGLKLGAAVRLVGSLPPASVATWLRAADLFALPTYDEGCCNAILEALACGLPVVTTPVGDNAPLVDSPRRGLLVPPDDPDALAEGIDAALQRSWDRAAIAAHGADYTWREVARRTSAFFQERLEGGFLDSGVRPPLPGNAELVL